MKLSPSRKEFIDSQSSQSYFLELEEKLQEVAEAGEIVFPSQKDIYKAYQLTALEDLSVVILWQDPYHGVWQAHGLAFSVQEWIKIPPSLRNIYKEIEDDMWEIISDTWDLTDRANQWVFLLNAVLTVGEWKAWSHAWWWRENFTDATITYISQQKEWVVFLLWGNYARSKKNLIDTSKHIILESSHPSPLSSYRWFLGCKHFSQTNEYLKQQWKHEIVW